VSTLDTGIASSGADVREADSVTLGVDAGQSGSRFLLIGPGGLRTSWTEPGAPAGISPVKAMNGLLLASVMDRLPALGLRSVHRVGAGLTGFHGGTQSAAGNVLARWAPRLGTQQVHLADDAVTSFVGALGTGAGVVVAAGTGVTVLASDGEARAVRVNGWGPTLGDEGGSYWVGQQALRVAYRFLDGRGGSLALADLAAEFFGDLTALPATLAASPDRVARVASFSREVARAAQRGDADARAIFASAGHHLAQATIAAARGVGFEDVPGMSVRVACVGGLFQAGRVLSEPFEAALSSSNSRMSLTKPAGDALMGAVSLSTDINPSRFGILVDVAVTA
jgi:glucosamine kinase